MGWQSHRKDWLCAEFTSHPEMTTLKMKVSNDSRKEIAMTSTLIVIALMILRLVVPAALLLTIGEAIRRHSEGPGNLRGA